MVTYNRPATFERDTKHLLSNGYKLTAAMSFDQFYWSTHLELVATFQKYIVMIYKAKVDTGGGSPTLLQLHGESHQTETIVNYNSLMAENKDFKDIIRGALAARPILLLGEAHNEPETVHVIAAHLPTARAAGATHLCTELAVYNQPVLNGFARGDISYQEMKEFFERVRVKEPQAMADLIAAARENGVHVHAVDYRFQLASLGFVDARADPLFQKAMQHETQTVKAEVAEYYRLGDDVYSNRNLADQLSAKRIQDVTYGEKALVMYGDFHLINMNTTNIDYTDAELSQNLPESKFTYVRIHNSRQSEQKLFHKVENYSSVKKTAEYPRLVTCNEQARRADFIYITGEQRGFKTFDADNYDRGAGVDLPLWRGQQPCQLGIWEEALQGLKHMVGLPQGEVQGRQDSWKCNASHRQTPTA